MDYNKLKSFITVAENRSLSRAAKILQHTQSAISQQVEKLEEELQTKLLERVGKQIVLTPEGKQIFELGKEKLGDIDEQVDWVVSKGKNLKGSIYIGCASDYSTPFPFFSLLGDFRKKFPNINFEVSFDTSQHIEEKLLENKLDMGLLLNFELREHFDTYQVATARHHLVTSKEYLDTHGPFNTLDTVLEADLIDFDLNFACFRSWLKKHFERRLPDLIQRTPVITVPNYLASKDIIKAGHGIAVLPQYLIEKEMQSGDLLRILPQKSDLSVWLDLALKKSRKTPIHEQVFIEFLQNS